MCIEEKDDLLFKNKTVVLKMMNVCSHGYQKLLASGKHICWVLLIVHFYQMKMKIQQHYLWLLQFLQYTLIISTQMA